MITLRPSYSILLYTLWYNVVQALSSCPYGDGYRQIWYGIDPRAHRAFLQNSIWSNTLVQPCDHTLAKSWPSPQYFSNKKIVTLASFDLEILHNIMSDIQLYNFNNNILVAFYFISNGNYNYLGCSETECEILEKVFKKYNHYISLSNENVQKYKQINSCWYIDNTNYITGKKDTCSEGNNLYNGMYNCDLYNNEYVMKSKQNLNLNGCETRTVSGIQCNMELKSFVQNLPEEKNMVCTPINININLGSQTKKKLQDEERNNEKQASDWNDQLQQLNQNTENTNDVKKSKDVIPSGISYQNIAAKICGSNQVSYYPYTQTYQSITKNIQEQEKEYSAPSTSSNFLQVSPGIFTSYSTDFSSDNKFGYQPTNFDTKDNINTAPFAASSFSNYQYQTQIQKSINQIDKSNSLSILNLYVDQVSSQLYPCDSVTSKFEEKGTINSNNDNKIYGNTMYQYSVSNVSPSYVTQTQSSIQMLPNAKSKNEEGLDSQIKSNIGGFSTWLHPYKYQSVRNQNYPNNVMNFKSISNLPKSTSANDIENENSLTNNRKLTNPQNVLRSIVNVNLGTINYSPESQIQRPYKPNKSQQFPKPNPDWTTQGFNLKYTPGISTNYPSLTKSIATSSSDSSFGYKQPDNNAQTNYIAHVSEGSSQLTTKSNSILKNDNKVSTAPKQITETVISNINVEPFRDNNVQLYPSTSNFIIEPVSTKSLSTPYRNILKSNDLNLCASISQSTVENYPAKTQIENSIYKLSSPSNNPKSAFSACTFQGTSTSYLTETKMDRFVPTSSSNNAKSFVQTKNKELKISNVDITQGSSINYLSSSQIIPPASTTESKTNMINGLADEQENLHIPTYLKSNYESPKSFSQIKTDVSSDLSNDKRLFESPTSDKSNSNKFSYPNTDSLSNPDFQPNKIHKTPKNPTYSVSNISSGTSNYYPQSTQFDSKIKYSSPVSTKKQETTKVYSVFNVGQASYTNFQNQIQINNQDNISLKPKPFIGIPKPATYKDTSNSDISSLYSSASLKAPVKQNFDATNNSDKAKGDLKDSASYPSKNDDSKSQSTKQYFNSQNIHASVDNFGTSTAYPFKFETIPAKTKSRQDSNIIGYNYKASAIPSQSTSFQPKIDIETLENSVKQADKPYTLDNTYKAIGVPGFSTPNSPENGILNSDKNKLELPKASEIEYKATGTPGMSTMYPSKIEFSKLQKTIPKDRPPKVFNNSYKAASTVGSSTSYPYKIEPPSIPSMEPPNQTPKAKEYTYKGTSTTGISTVYASSFDINPSQANNQEYQDKLSEFKTTGIPGISNIQPPGTDNLLLQKTKPENRITNAEDNNFQTPGLNKIPTWSTPESNSQNLQTTQKKYYPPNTYSYMVKTTPGTLTYYPYQTDTPTKDTSEPKKYILDKAKELENNYKFAITPGVGTFQSPGFDISSSQSVKQDSTYPSNGLISSQASNQKPSNIKDMRGNVPSPTFDSSQVGTSSQNYIQSENHVSKPTDNIIGKPNNNILNLNKISDSSPASAEKILNFKVAGVSNGANTLYPTKITYISVKDDKLPETEENKIRGVNSFAQAGNIINTFYPNQVTNKTPIGNDETSQYSQCIAPLLGITTTKNNETETLIENDKDNQNYFTKPNENISSKRTGSELNILGTLSSPSHICNNKFSWQRMPTSLQQNRTPQTPEFHITGSQISQATASFTPFSYKISPSLYKTEELSQNIPSSSNSIQDISSSLQQNFDSFTTPDIDLDSSRLISSNLIKPSNSVTPFIKDDKSPASLSLFSSTPCPMTINNKDTSPNLPNINPEYIENNEKQYSIDNNGIKTEKQEICLGNTCIMNYLPSNAKDTFTIQTNDPNIKLKGWKSQAKIITRKLVIETILCPVTNFIPIVNNSGLDKNTVQCIARDAIKNKYGDPVVIKGFVNMYKPFAMVSNVDKIKLKSSGCILWPTMNVMDSV